MLNGELKTGRTNIVEVLPLRFNRIGGSKRVFRPLDHDAFQRRDHAVTAVKHAASVLAELTALDSLFQNTEQTRGADKESFGILHAPGAADHTLKNGVRLIQVQPHSRQILQPQISVPIDVSIGEPWFQIAGTTGKCGKQ